ncbi:hypothetical protein QTJ16_000168 [Diplocarpon rosae]|uniref:TauD/TfdA-like domain-containing protein n=1 Tax=Diplocarpon rosae TaxID=946125 RepID=A0AAD9T3H6_9HELO|nr:hypothetical protein QTJ16_000168 [Diplocarpon rosae]
MAPSRLDPQDDYAVQEEPKIVYDINIPYKPQTDEDARHTKGRTEFPDYLPVWEKGQWHEDVPIFDYEDPALRADPEMPHLFAAGVSAQAVTPRMGTILTGLKLETLSPAAKDELALLICERKFVVMREQLGFLNSGPQFQVDFMSHFGKLSRQPVTGTIPGHPEFHIIHRDGNEKDIARFFQHKMTTTLWHHDVSYERQPPGYVMLGILACPDIGGDTVIADMATAYQRLSPLFQTMVDQLQAVHTSRHLINHAKTNHLLVRSNPVDSLHPVVRVHPVTGEKAIFYNSEFPDEVIGLKDLEAEVVTKLLMDTVKNGHDFQARVHWEKHSVVMFDNRTTLHTGTVDYDTTAQARHLFRLAAMTEVPMSVADSKKVRG